MMMALTPKLRMMMALNAETENDDGSERQNLEEVVALNVETEKIWWHVNTETEKRVALNVQIEKIVTLNAQIENRWWL